MTETESTSRASLWERLAPEPVTVVRLALLTVIAVLMAETTVDPDLWGHVRFGHDIVAAGTIARVDPYSFTSDVPWMNHEWLAEVVMYAAYALGGSAGLVLLKLVLVFGALTLVFRALERSVYTLATRDVLFAVTAIGIASVARTVRPQVFSIFLFASLLTLLAPADRGRRRALWLVPPLMILWTNVHGGWLVGLGVLGVWLLCALLDAGQPWASRRTYLAVGVVALIATLANPYGIGMWQFLGQTVRLSRADITEWQPVFRMPIPFVLLWCGFVAVALVLALKGGEAGRRRAFAIIVPLAFGSFLVSRLMAFLSVSVPLLLAPRASAQVAVRRTPPGRGPTKPASALLFAAVVSVVLAGAVLTSQSAQCIAMPASAAWLPDADAARFVTANKLSGRMLTWFDWGEYAIWHFSPGLRVSMDGRRETVYSDGHLAAHLEFYDGGPRAMDYAKTLAPDFIWLPTRLRVVPMLERDGWVPVFKGGASVVFARSPVTPVSLAVVAGPRCFPGP